MDAADEVNRWVGEIDYPMYIVTVAAGAERSGCLIGFATQCSVDPLRFLVCLSDKNRTFRISRGASADPAQFGFHRARRFEPGHDA